MPDLERLSPHILDAMDAGVIAVDSQRRILVWNRWMERHTRLPAEVVRGKSLARVFPDLDQSRLMDAISLALHQGEGSILSRTIDGSSLALYPPQVDETAGEPISQDLVVQPLGPRGGEHHCLIQIRDATSDHQREITLRTSEERYRSIVEDQSELVCRFLPDTTLTFVNDSFARFHRADADALLGRRFTDLFPEAGRAEILERIGQCTAERPVADHDLEFTAEDGSTHWHHWRETAFFDDHGQLVEFQGVGRDVTERKLADQHIEFLAHHDPLTGLPNRAMFQQHIKRSLAQAERSGDRVAILSLDLDHFKQVNDSLGHAAGDTLLRQVSERLLACIRGADIVARVGGDEFAIVQVQIDIADKASILAERVIESLSRPFPIEDHDVRSGCSVGATIYPNDSDDIEQLLKNADLALYRAKESGRGVFEFYSVDMGAEARQRVEIADGLRDALGGERLKLFFQPKHRIDDGVMVGCEALLRWQGDDGEPVSPAVFIAVAESTGLIIRIGDWVLDQVCRQIRRWSDAALAVVPVSVNLSAAQFRDRGLAAKVRDALGSSRVEAGLIELEITETALMEDAETAAATLGQLAELGITLSIDDFGTGYSSLNYLKQFPVGRLKIDQTFVRDITLSEQDEAIARAVTHLGHDLGMKVLAEGVETEAQRDMLHQIGCDELQGYLASAPLPPDEFAALLEADQDGPRAREE